MFPLGKLRIEVRTVAADTRNAFPRVDSVDPDKLVTGQRVELLAVDGTGQPDKNQPFVSSFGLYPGIFVDFEYPAVAGGAKSARFCQIGDRIIAGL